MNILITCHKPPGFNHPNLYQLNTNTYKKNKTRKNIMKNLKHKGDTIYYLDTREAITYFNNTGKELTILPPPNTTPNWFSKWENVPDNSMDIIWGQNCPILDPFTIDELVQIHLDFEDLTWASFLGPPGTINDVWRNLLKDGHRILKAGGKIILPYPLRDDLISDSRQIGLIARIINMEVIPEFLFRINVIEPFSTKHTDYLKNMVFIDKNNSSGILKMDYLFLVFEKF
jgi:hypothetical protein